MPKVSAQINASPQQVWDIIGDGNRLNEWFSPVDAIRGAEPAPAIEAGSDFNVRMIGRVSRSRFRVHEAITDQKLRAALGPVFAHPIGIPMHAEILVQPSGDGSNVSVEFSCHRLTRPRSSSASPGWIPTTRRRPHSPGSKRWPKTAPPKGSCRGPRRRRIVSHRRIDLAGRLPRSRECLPLAPSQRDTRVAA